MNPKLSVTELITAVNIVLGSLKQVTVEGEVDEFKIVHNKWVIFSLKDDKSTVNCFMPVWQYKTQIEDGMLVRATGQPKVRDKGFFSFVLSDVQPAGEGALKRAFVLLQQKLENEGLFAPERKRPLPRWPEHIALITSRDAAAYSDFLKVLQARQGGLTISFIHTQVQGTDAPKQLIAALNTANTDLKKLDAIILVRGGGSLEDLQAFNDESVIRAVAASRTPIIVGVGHERDTTLAELAADLRASTPSNAAELLVVSRQEALLNIESLTNSLRLEIDSTLQKYENNISHAVNEMQTRVSSTASQINRQIDRLRGTTVRFKQSISQRQETLRNKKNILRNQITETIEKRTYQFQSMQRMLATLSPQETLRRGYSITRVNGSILKRSAQVKAGDTIVTRLSDGEVSSEVKDG